MAKNERKEKKKGINKTIKWLIGVGLLAGLSFLGWKMWHKQSGWEKADIKRGEVVEKLILTGEIKAENQASLRFATSGELEQVKVGEGEKVEKGQVLAKLDANSQYQAYEKAVADLRAATATVEKVYDEVEGHDDDETYQQKEDRTTAEVRRDKAYRALQIAKENLSNVYLRAPFDGVVSRVNNPYGQVNVTYAEGQIKLVDPSSLYFEVSADQTEVIEIGKGQKVKIILDALMDEDVEGEVTYVDLVPKEGEAGVVYRIKVKLDDQPERIRVGMGGDAEFVLNRKEEVLNVPFDFLQSDEEGDYLLVNDPKNKVYVETGLEGEDRVEVKGEINEKDVIYD